MKFCAQWKTRNSGYNGSFTGGLSLAKSEDVVNSKIIFDDESKAVFESNGCIVEAFHIKKGNVTECFTRFINNTDETVTIDLLSSFCIEDIFADRLHRAESFWSAEGRLLSQDLVELNMEKSWNNFGTRIEKFGQIGSMPVRKWFPFAVLENSKTKEFVGVQIYCASSWQIEIYRDKEPITLTGGIADFDFGHWSKNIEPNSVFTTPKAVIAVGNSLEEVCDRLVKAQSPRIAETDREMPVIFNEYCTTWGNPTPENLEKIAKRLSESGIKYLVIDSGWYKEDGDEWWDSIGDWNISRKIFPNGLKPVCDMIKSYGLIPGIWFEFENVGERSAVYKMSDHLLRRFGVPITVSNRRFLNMRDKWVKDYLTEKVIKMLKDNGFGYLKVDYNDNIGVGCDGAESLGEGLRQAVSASQDFFRKIAKEIPELVIENCSSGGHRLEPSMMELVSQASFSDAHECVSIPIIAANLHRLIRIEQSQIWAVLRKDDDIHRINYSLSSGFLGRLCVSGDVFDISDEKLEVVKEAVSFYKKAKSIIKNGFTSLIDCTAVSYNKPVGYQRVLRTLGSEALLVVHTFENGGDPPLKDILDKYLIADSFGSELTADFRGKVFLLKEKPKKA